MRVPKFCLKLEVQFRKFGLGGLKKMTRVDREICIIWKQVELRLG